MRSRLRIRLTEPISAVFSYNRLQGRGLIRDVSLGGMFVRSPHLLPVGTNISAAVTTPAGCRATIEGVVRWNTNDTPGKIEHGFGVCLTRFSREYLGFVDGAIAAARFAKP